MKRRGARSFPVPEKKRLNQFLATETLIMSNVLKVSDRVATGIKLALDAAQIDMPFPHTVVLFHDATGSRTGDIKREDHLQHFNGTGRNKGSAQEDGAGQARA